MTQSFVKNTGAIFSSPAASKMSQQRQVKTFRRHDLNYLDEVFQCRNCGAEGQSVAAVLRNNKVCQKEIFLEPISGGSW